MRPSASLKILYVAPPLAAQPRRGYELRSYHQLRLLSLRHRITFVTLAPTSSANSFPEDLVRSCERVEVCASSPPAIAKSMLRVGVGAGLPFQTAVYTLPALQRRLAAELASGAYDVAHVQLTRLAGAFERARASVGSRIPAVLDMVDALSLNMARRAAFEPNVLKRAAAGIESRRLATFERDLCRRFDRILLVSSADAAAFGPTARIVVNPCGVEPPRRDPIEPDPDRVIFSGNLGYFANVDAVRWCLDRVWPEIRHARPQARLIVAGARPTRLVRRLVAASPGVELLADVPDLGHEIARSGVAIAPLRAGSGQSLKVLEAMVNGTPVVATRRAIEGLDVMPGRVLLVADDPLDFAACVNELLVDRTRAAALAATARSLVETQYTWEQSVERLESIYADAIASPLR